MKKFEIWDPDFFLKYSQAHLQFIRKKIKGEKKEKSAIAYPDEESPCFQQQSWEEKLFWILAVNHMKLKIWSQHILKKIKVHPPLSRLLMGTSFWRGYAIIEIKQSGPPNKI